MPDKGFTILEVIIAVFILTIAILSSFYLIQQTIIGASQNQSQLTAYYLGQEGVEIARNLRDTNWLQRKDWQEDMVPEKTENIGRFERTTYISQLEPDVLEVKVLVEWKDRGKEYGIEVINHLYNWYGN